MNKLRVTQKEYQKLNSLLTNIIGKKQIFHVIKKREKVWKNNKTIALDILYVPYNIKVIRHAYNSKYNFNPIRMGFFGTTHGCGGGKNAPSLKSVTHILQL